MRFLFLFLIISLNALGNDSKTKVIKHPGSSDGLTRIDSEGVYYYDVKNELKNQSGHIRLGASENPEITIDIIDLSENVTAVTFDDIYEGASKATIGYDYEYFFTLSGGKLGVQLGAAFQYAQGFGRLVIDPSKKATEKFSFLTIPIFVGGIYRFEYKDNQYIAPYLAGGGVYVGLFEKREDRSKINTIGAPGFYGSAGLLVNVTAFDKEMDASFESEYEISNLWINLEFKTVQVTSDVFNYQSNFIQGGLGFDY